MLRRYLDPENVVLFLCMFTLCADQCLEKIDLDILLSSAGRMSIFISTNHASTDALCCEQYKYILPWFISAGEDKDRKIEHESELFGDDE